MALLDYITGATYSPCHHYFGAPQNVPMETVIFYRIALYKDNMCLMFVSLPVTFLIEYFFFFPLTLSLLMLLNNLYLS